VAKVEKKLVYWSSQRLNATSREVIGNSVLISFLLYFLALWGGTKAGLTKITSKIRNFFWSGSATRTRNRVAWKTCCLYREEGSLNMIDPQEALTALMAKWVVTALEPGISNFKGILRHRLLYLQPFSIGTWAPSLEWCLSPTHRGSSGSALWKRTTKSWKLMVQDLRMLPPLTYSEWQPLTSG
jgi:hypothetical protein